MNGKRFAALIVLALLVTVALRLLLPQYDVVEYGLLVVAALVVTWLRMRWKRRNAAPQSRTTKR